MKRGPVGVIVSTMNDAFETGKVVAEDLKSGQLNPLPQHTGKSDIISVLEEKGKFITIEHVFVHLLLPFETVIVRI